MHKCYHVRTLITRVGTLGLIKIWENTLRDVKNH